MAWAGCNANGNGGLDIGFYIALAIVGVFIGQYLFALLLLIPCGTIFYVCLLVTYEDEILEKYN